MHTLLRVIVIVAAPSLGACALLERPSESVLYAPYLAPVAPVALAVPAAPAAEREAPARTLRIEVEQPRAIAPFDSARIAVAPVPGEIEFYRDGRWRDSAPTMLQDLLLQAFDANPAVQAIASGGGGRADFVLHSELRAFTAEYRGAGRPTVHVQLAVRLVRRANADSVAARTFDAEAPCRGTRLPDVFAAFQDALNRLVRDVAAWSTAAADAGA